MNTTALVPVFGESAAGRIMTFQIRRIKDGSMGKLAMLLEYLADNRSLRLVHTCENASLGMLTAFLSGDAASLELLKLRVESVFPEFEVLLAPGLGSTLRKAA